MRTLKNVARDWRVVWPRMRRRNSDRKQQNFVLICESTEKPRSGDAVSHEPSGAASSSAPAAAASGSGAMAVSSSSAYERFRSDEVPDHGVKRVRWSPHAQDTKEFDPNESSDASCQEIHPLLHLLILPAVIYLSHSTHPSVIVTALTTHLTHTCWLKAQGPP